MNTRIVTNNLTSVAEPWRGPHRGIEDASRTRRGYSIEASRQGRDRVEAVRMLCLCTGVEAQCRGRVEDASRLSVEASRLVEAQWLP